MRRASCSPPQVAESVVGAPELSELGPGEDVAKAIVSRSLTQRALVRVLGLRVVLARGLHDERDRPPRQQFSLQCLEILGKLVSARSTNNASRSTTTDAQTHVVDGNRHSIHF